jgi:hypothetical protein
MTDLAPFRRNLFVSSPMMRGGDVLAVQQALATTGARLTQDALFGLATQAIVRAFQERSGLEVDGIVGPDTWGALFRGRRQARDRRGDPTARNCYDLLLGMGWPEAQACGIVANIRHESAFDPAAVGDGGAAYGLAQWHPDRQRDFRDWKGNPIGGSTLEEQLNFIHHEMTEGKEQSAGRKLRASRTAREAGAVVSRFYERPADRDGEAERRGATSEAYFRLFTDPGSPPVPEPPSPFSPVRTAAQILAPRWMADLLRPHARYQGGIPWRLTPDGVRVGDIPPELREEDVARLHSLMDLHGRLLLTVLDSGHVPIELVLAALGAAEVTDGTPLLTLGCNITFPERTPDRICAGPMHTVLSLARTALKRPALTLEDLKDPATALRAGAAVLALQASETGFDPPLVAAAYAAGGLYRDAAAPPWLLAHHRPGPFIDRFVAFFNAAMSLTAALPPPGRVATFQNLIDVPAAGPEDVGGPYAAPAPLTWIGRPSVGSGECVALVQHAAAAPHTSFWRRGDQVQGKATLEPGTVIATFDADGRYGSRADGQCHAALFLSQDASGIVVVDQWNIRDARGVIIGHQAPHERVLRFNQADARKVNRGEAFFVVF